MVMSSARQRRGRWWLLTLAVSLLSVAQGAGAADIPVYTDTLSPAWQNWSWSSTLNFANRTPVHTGTQSLAVTYTAAWAGLYLHPTAGYATTQYDRLTFWLHGGSGGNQRLRIVANGDTAHTYPVTALANTWTQVTVPLSVLGSPATLSDLYWQDVTGAAQPVFYLDDIQLLASTAPPPTLSIDGGAGRMRSVMLSTA